MMCVPSYQVIEFLDWLTSRQVRLDPEHFDRDRLLHLARRYLAERPLGPTGAGDQPLEFLLRVFQCCPMIREPSVIEQMNHFARCGECMEHLVCERISIRVPELHPFLREFLFFIRASSQYARLVSLDAGARVRNRELWRVGDPEGIHHTFNLLIREYGEQLREAFRAFVERSPEKLVRDYERWRAVHRLDPGWREEPFREPRAFGRIEDGTIPIGQNESPEISAERLVGSVEQLLRGGFYDQAIAEQPTFQRLLCLISGRFENLGQSLGFLEWLRARHPRVDIAGDIPSDKTVELVHAFCEEQGYANAASFAREVEQWLRGEGDTNVLGRLWSFVSRNRRFDRRHGHGTAPFARYRSVPMHGMFLFLSSGDFPSFIEKHWEDLNQLTGDSLDIYYSKADLKRRVSGYETLEQLRSLEIKTTDLPALVLWDSALKDAHVVPLGRLDHQDVVEVVKRIVQGIRDERGIAEISGETRAWVEDRLRQVEGLALGGYVKSKFIITGGENVQVFNEPHDKVVAIAATQGASVSRNVFNMDDPGPTALSDDDVLKLRQVVAQIQRAAEGAEISQSLAFEAAAHLCRLLEARQSHDEEGVRSAISRWRQWFGSLDAKALKVLGSIADAVSLGSTLAKVLGFPVP